MHAVPDMCQPKSLPVEHDSVEPWFCLTGWQTLGTC